jgi:hypothetical protein
LTASFCSASGLGRPTAPFAAPFLYESGNAHACLRALHEAQRVGSSQESHLMKPVRRVQGREGQGWPLPPGTPGTVPYHARTSAPRAAAAQRARAKSGSRRASTTVLPCCHILWRTLAAAAAQRPARRQRAAGPADGARARLSSPPRARAARERVSLCAPCRTAGHAAVGLQPCAPHAPQVHAHGRPHSAQRATRAVPQRGVSTGCVAHTCAAVHEAAVI